MMYIPHRAFTTVVVSNMQQALKTTDDKELGKKALGSRLILMVDFSSIPADKVYKWLFPPDSSRNYNEAREKFQKDTCSWFTDGTRFEEWKMKADILLWVYGPGECSGRPHDTLLIITTQLVAVRLFYGKPPSKN